MKLVVPPALEAAARVAPCAGAWVEMPCLRYSKPHFLVAPCAGAWVEIWKAASGIPRPFRRPLCGGVG